MSLLLFFGTYFLATFLKKFKNERFFPAVFRNYISNFSVIIAIFLMVIGGENPEGLCAHGVEAHLVWSEPRVHLFTGIQLTCFILFPIMLLLLIAIRKLLDLLFSQHELRVLDDVLPQSKRRERMKSFD